MTMADKEAEASAAAETERDVTMLETSVEDAEAVVVAEEVAAVEEAVEATATTTMVKEVVTDLMEAEAAKGIMDTTATHTRGINNTHSHISNNRCLQPSRSLLPH